MSMFVTQTRIYQSFGIRILLSPVPGIMSGSKLYNASSETEVNGVGKNHIAA